MKLLDLAASELTVSTDMEPLGPIACVAIVVNTPARTTIRFTEHPLPSFLCQAVGSSNISRRPFLIQNLALELLELIG